jgi:hypothetical protein
LHIIVDNGMLFGSDVLFDWDYLFEVLISSSPTCLFTYKFSFDEAPKLDSLKLFLDNWKNRPSMLLKTIKGYDFLYEHTGYAILMY